MSQTIEAKGSERYVRFTENRDSTNPPQELCSKELALSWTIYGGRVFECEVWIVEDEDGGYSAFAARLPGVVAQADEIDIALFEIERALGAAIASYLEHAEPIPWTEDPIQIDSQPLLKQWILVNA